MSICGLWVIGLPSIEEVRFWRRHENQVLRTAGDQITSNCFSYYVPHGIPIDPMLLNRSGKMQKDFGLVEVKQPA